MSAGTIVGLAEAQIGKPYVFGDEGPNDFDCSGLVQYVYGLVGIKTPRIAADQQAWATPTSNPLPGDLVFYGAPAHHVGIYVGGGQMIDAPHTGAMVRLESVGTPTNYGRVPGSGALLAVPAAVLTGAADTVSNWLGGARSLVLEGSAVVLGLALIGYGVYRSVSNRRDEE